MGNHGKKEQLELLHTVTTPDCDVSMPGGMRVEGPEQLTSLLRAYFSAFPDFRHAIVDSVESPAGDKIAVELRITGTHTGPMQMPEGEIPATGRSVVWESVDLVTVRDGKIAAWHTYYDQLAFLQQLGLVPEPAGVGA